MGVGPAHQGRPLLHREPWTRFYEFCDPAPACQSCTQAGNPHTDRVDATQAFTCTVNPDTAQPPAPAPSATDGDSGGLIPYNSDDLSNAAFSRRVDIGWPVGKNVATARVEGLDEIIVGFSKGDGFHSEDDILEQLAARGIDSSRITHLYSERQPCEVCAPLLAELAPNAVITWSVPWAPDRLSRRAANTLLESFITQAGG